MRQFLYGTVEIVVIESWSISLQIASVHGSSSF